MNKNLDLIQKLAAQRERSRTDAQERTPKLPVVPKTTETTETKPEARKTRPPRPSKPPTARIRKRQQDKQGKTGSEQGPLERTTITLKPQDQTVLNKAQAFFVRNGVKAPASSTLIRLALANLAETLEAKPDHVQEIFEQIRSQDGRRNPPNR